MTPRFPMWSPLPLAALSLLLGGGCIFGTSNASRKNNAPEPIPAPSPAPATAAERDARVQPAWQARMLRELEASGDAFVDAWGLFSEGGWSDAGQVIILVSADRSRTRLITSSPNRTEVATDRALTAAEWQAIEPQTKAAAALDDVNEQVFDGLVFELVHAKRDGGTSLVVDRLFVKQAGTRPHPEHDAVVNGFQALRK